MSFIQEIKQRAKANLKTIILPEATDPRILKATEIIMKILRKIFGKESIYHGIYR